MNSRAYEVVAELLDQLAYADALIDEQVERIEALEAEVALLRDAFMAA